MNAINIIPKNMVVHGQAVEVTAVNWRTHDDPFNRRLRIIVNSQIQIVVTGDQYDALGQWTDETIRGLILTKLGFVPVTS
ncbi:MAG: hypothetical protein WCH99_05440 [Verrucomicrobiota bacterium]